jgi:hypothetical protein
MTETKLVNVNHGGDYDLVMHWMQGEDEHTEVVRFTMSQPLPGLPISGLLMLAAILVLVGLHSMRRDSEALRKVRL